MGAKKYVKKDRIIRIYAVSEGSERLVHVGPSATTVAALDAYYKDQLKPMGHTMPHRTGNVLLVQNKHGLERMYKAVEAK